MLPGIDAPAGIPGVQLRGDRAVLGATSAPTFPAEQPEQCHPKFPQNQELPRALHPLLLISHRSTSEGAGVTSLNPALCWICLLLPVLPRERWKLQERLLQACPTPRTWGSATSCGGGTSQPSPCGCHCSQPGSWAMPEGGGQRDNSSRGTWMKISIISQVSPARERLEVAATSSRGSSAALGMTEGGKVREHPQEG